jgi:xanthine dehydrogenase small subunit
MATIAGNFVNASPIGDLTIFFLALDAQLILSNGKKKREVALRKFYKSYKIIDKKSEEYIETIWFKLPETDDLFNFEKVSKRTHLDIASVNSAISITLKKDRIASVGLSAGGVGPIPLFLAKTSSFLEGKKLSKELVEDAINVTQKEISPISDARGSEEYKRLLLGQLIKAHFITLFASLEVEKILH